MSEVLAELMDQLEEIEGQKGVFPVVDTWKSCLGKREPPGLSGVQ